MVLAKLFHAAARAALSRTFPAGILVLAGSLAFAAAPPRLQELSKAYVESGGKADRAALREYAEKASPASLQGLVHFAIGMGDYQAESYIEAAEELRLASSSLDTLADYAIYYRARSLAGAENHAGAAWVLKDYDQRFANSRLVGGAFRLRAESLIESGHREEARSLLEVSTERLSPHVRLFLLARILDLDNRLTEAVRAYRQVYYKYPLSDLAEEAEDALTGLRRRIGKRYPSAPAAWRLERADVLFGGRKYSQAKAEYRRAVAGLKGAARDHAQVRSGVSDYRRMWTTAAYQHLRKLKVSDPEAEAERLYYLGECARRKRRSSEFQQCAEELGRKYPQSAWYEEALFSLGNFYLLENDPRQYREYYHRAAREFPKGKYAARAHWKVGWRAYLDSDPRALALLEEHLRRYPRSPHASAALYWLGRLAEKNDDAAGARALYTALTSHFPHYYYAFRARERMNELGAAVNDAALAGPAYLGAIPAPRSFRREPTAETKHLLDRGETLFQLGLYELAERELQSASYRKPDSHLVGLALARQAAERGRFHEGLRSMKRYGYGYLRLPFSSMNRQYWESLFPMPYGEQLRARAKPHKLDPYLVAGLIRQESEFNPRAKSRAGARGLMQILPGTGRMLARRVGLGRLSTARLYAPDLSLRLGTLHFRTVYDQFGGDLEYTLAAYNAGEHRVEKWQTWGSFQEPGTFTETIPFTETRGYVQAVLRNTAIYRQLYGPESERQVTPSRAALRGAE